MTIEQYLKKHAGETPNKMAAADIDRSLTYAELWSKVKCIAYIMKVEYKIKKHDYVLIRSSQTLEHIIVYFGIHLLGAVAVPLETDVPMETMLEMQKETGASLILSHKEEAIESSVSIFDLKKVYEKMDAVNEPDSWEDFPLDSDYADVMLTTGTTGKSKGVILSHENLFATAENIMYGLDIKDSDCMLVVGPLNHANPIRKVYTAIIKGSSVVVIQGMSSMKNFFGALDKYPINCMCIPPSGIRVLLQITGDKLSEYRDRIEYMENSTAPMPENLRQKLGELLPDARLYNSYGSSEAGAIVIYDYNHYKKEAGCAGKPSHHANLFFVDDEGNKIESSKENPGLLVCEGKVNMQGYLGDEELTKQALRNGLIYTNDIGYFAEDGFVYLLGRKDDVINIGGYKIAPTEVEEIIELFDGVEECMLVEELDSVIGSFLKLSVVVNESFVMDELKKYMKEKLESYKVPKVIDIVEDIPKTFNGKKDRKKKG
ncbi:MAG: acyl--CoA ligase [Lachnospiraceae bacterium]|nr:acyl--CoA ligase [Lachnospiraceae bacterium]